QTYYYRVVLTVTDAGGLSATNEVRIYPDCPGIAPEISWANPASIVYGMPLSSTQLNATANAPGTFFYSPAAGKVLSAGNGQTLSAVFMPTDTLTYRTIFSTVPIDVTPAPLTIAAHNIGKQYGAPMPALTASYGGLVNGDTPDDLDIPVSLSTSATAASPVGNYPIAVSGAGDANYAISHVDGTFVVTKALPIILWTNPSPIVSGVALSDRQLNASANVPGTVVYDPPSGTILPAGNGQTLTASFTPADSQNYGAVTAMVFIHVIDTPAPPTVLVVSAVSSNQINLRWRDNSDSEQGFAVEHSTNGSDFTQFTIVGPNVTNCTDTGLSSTTTYYYRVRAFNVAGDSPYSEILSAKTVMSLGEAVDAPLLIWRTGGNTSFVAQAAVTHDGLDAAQSGIIGHSQESWMETTVSGPGALTFWWKVSAEPSNDKLRFSVNGSEQFAINGEVNWQFRTVSISSGSKVLRWRYTKNSSKVGGQDRAWVDQVQFTPPSPPTIVSQPLSQNSGEGAAVVFTVTASGTTPFTYRWRRDGISLANGGNISGATAASLTLSSVQSTQAGTYSVVVSNSVGGVTSSGALLSLLTRADAIDAPGLLWTSGGSAPWLAQTTVTHESADAVQSGTTPHSGESWLQTTVSGPGTLKFWWKVSSQTNSDLLGLYVDGSERLRVSGESDWSPQTFDVPPGNHTLRWRYWKNSGTTTGQDRAWLDQVQFGPSAPEAPIIIGQPVSRNVNVGATVNFSVVATGTAPLGYQWLSNEVALSNGINVNGATTPTLTLGNVQMDQAANYSVLVSNEVAVAASSNAVLTVSSAPPEPLTLANAVDAPSLNFVGAGNASWIPQTSITEDGVDATQSGVIAPDQNTRLETRVNGPGTVSFWWKVSSEPINDQLRFYIGDTEQTRISGEVDWQFRTFNVPAGSNILLKWRYSKNATATAGQDAAWVDQVQFVPE
ncbi:MAG TPA: MBG domain-containing protein, partial [Candidatus Acidoferrum sp.]|nr:MBG domain-containing protein [Candidatus Acidoferrum sp.]